MAEHNEGDNLPFNSRTARALTAFIKMMDGFIKRSGELNLVGLFDLIINETGYQSYVSAMADGEERWENVLELRTVAQEYKDLASAEGLAVFLEGVALVSDVDGMDSSADAVTLITLHQAKGLEFPVVFIVGLEEGMLPHIRSFDDPAQMEEERRLCYVGITRAKQRVYLLRAFRRSFMGSSGVNQPSRFLQDIPRHLISGGGLWPGEESRIDESAYTWNSEPVQQSDFPELKTGDRVRHAQFGEGLVVSHRAVKDDIEVTVAFDGAGIKKLLLSFAKLEKV
jgi:DNA helicase-2/ATP-dependent DNA helicase PcrA